MVGQARNAGSAPMAVMATLLLPRGEVLSHPIPAPPSEGPGGTLPGMPDTGAGGGQAGAALSAGLGLTRLGIAALVACGWLALRRRPGRR